MTAAQAQAVVGDVAALTQAIVVLDQRYKNTPGWEPLAHSGRLGWASLAAALDVDLGQPDYAVARLRSIPPDTIVEPRVLSGFQFPFTRLDNRIADVI